MARLLALTQSSNFGGDDAVLLDLIRVWPADDHWAIALNRSHPGLDVYRKTLEGRAELIAFDGAPAAWDSFAVARRLSPLIAAARPDAVLVSSGGFPPTSLTVGFLLAARRAAVPRVALVLHNEPNLGSGFRAAWRWLRGRVAAHLCDALVSVSNDCAGKIAAVGGRPVQAILNGSTALPPSDPAALRAELGVPDGVPLVGTIANLEARKGLRVLLEAFSLLPCSEACLIIIGAEAEPAEATALRLLADAPTVSGRVFLAGYRQNARRFASIFDVSVIPSLRQESFGLLALDAMRAGRPVVASRVGGLLEIVEDGVTGLLVPPGNPAATAAAIAHFLADPELARRFGEAGRRRATERFNAGRMAAQYREVLLGNRKC